jgi:hypothetical protein
VFLVADGKRTEVGVTPTNAKIDPRQRYDVVVREGRLRRGHQAADDLGLARGEGRGQPRARRPVAVAPDRWRVTGPVTVPDGGWQADRRRQRQAAGGGKPPTDGGPT